MAQEQFKLQSAQDIAEQVMSTADPSDATHKLASAVHLIAEVMLGAPTPLTEEQIRAFREPQPQQGGSAGIVEAAPPPTAPIRSLASVPPGSYEAPRNEDGTAANASNAAAPSLYEPRRNEDGSVAT